MGKLILVTGGARSGKSSWAEKLVVEYGNDVLYIATAQALDADMAGRIDRHISQRPAHWQTLEVDRDFQQLLPPLLTNQSVVMLDCVTMLISNHLCQSDLDFNNCNIEQLSKLEESITNTIKQLLTVIQSAKIPFVVVTNEVGMSIVPENRLARVFQDIAGRINQLLARHAYEVYVCFSGLPLKLK